MLVSCKILRKGGSPVSFNNPDGSETAYLFTGPDEGPHVAWVDNDEHLHLLIASGGYLIVRTAPASPPATAGVSPSDPAPTEPAGDTEPVDGQPAPEPTDQLPAEPEAEPAPAEDPELAAATIDAPDGFVAPENDGSVLSPTLAELRAQYAARFGKMASPRWTAEELRGRIMSEPEA